MSEIDWSKAPEGYPLWLEYLGKALDGVPGRMERGGEWVCDVGDRYKTTRETYWSKPDEGYYRIHERPSPAWSGEGLPPVGADVDCKCTAKTRARDWFPAEVKYISPYTVVLVDYSTEELDGEFVAHPATLLFQPRRTPEQIAADEREAAIRAIIYDLQDAENLSSLPSIANCLYGKGYRKP